MKDMVRASDITEALTTIKVLNDKITELRKIQQAWEVTFDFDVEANESGGYDLKISAKRGEVGHRMTIPQEKIMAFNGELESLAAEIAVQLATDMISKTAKNAFVPEFMQKANNIIKLASRGGFAK